MTFVAVKSLNHNTDNLLAAIGLLAAVPAIYFFTGSFLKYEMSLLADVDIYVPSPAVMVGGLLIPIFLNLYPMRPQHNSIKKAIV